jgi:GNAT superfamily N-acetyltransferase
VSSKVRGGSDKRARAGPGEASRTLTRVCSGTELRELSAAQFTAELDALTALYTLAMEAPAAEAPGRRAIMERHAGYPAFRAVVALLPHAQAPGQDPGGDQAGGQITVIGFAYGFHGSAGQWWHELVQRSLTVHRSSESASHWLADSFEFAEVHVHPDHQGRGTGRAMMHTLAAGRPERTAVLSTPHGHTRARRLYRSLGFEDLLPDFTFPGTGPSYAIMGAALPLRDEPRPPAGRSASPSRW